VQISTLRFASRMMCVSNEPIQNVLQDPVVSLCLRSICCILTLSYTQLLVQQYERELDALRQELAMHDILVR